jgi:hypothetical protein
LNVSFLACFQVISNRLWAHTKQEKGHCVRTRNSQGFSLYNIKRENPFEGKLFVCKVAKSTRSPFLSEWEVWKRFLQSVLSFSSVKNLFFKFFESIKFQGESVCKRVVRFIESLRCVEERSLSC